MSTLTPREIVSELDRYIIGQHDAKRMVAIAMRNRWRRQQLDPELRDEIAPKNIILMGPTGVGKTEIARRLARLTGCPFFKVEATKFTEVGYVGRDVESMVRDLMEIGINLVRKEETDKVRIKAERNAEERVLDLLLPGNKPQTQGVGFYMSNSDSNAESGKEPERPKDDSTREKFRQMFRKGQLDDREIEVEVTVTGGPQMEIMAMPGMEDMGMQMSDMLGRMFPKKKKTRKMKIRDAYEVLIDEEADKLIDMDKVTDLARERVEQTGIIFIDEMDKIAARQDHGGTDVSREGVQRDLLPIVEGSVVNTKYGMIKTDHILFIAAGAFHFAKPSDLIPELQGRFPLREELQALGKDEFYRILTEPRNALTVQYKALLETEGITVDFSREALEEVAEFAQKINEETENIGARRLYTIMEKILADLSFEAPDKSGQSVSVDKEYVCSKLEDVSEDRDLSRYIL
ncbi:ATP-dependent protease ATPase subunit HslU [Salidesulfovibrio onnuriiensis]|uniref:ATP-dependent protease ATPase subunit HslU n=1 Tax=Salidesulfovibrio onnuriiensis TaxID=2583823 RepID=UPI00164FC916|nr:ATP-dependent protease ATPase subunit HslU [Salidesulfovibrio onnuriiensis]